MAHNNILAGLLVCIVGLSGCASGYQIGHQIEPARVRAINRGITTRDQLVASFGPNDTVELLPDGPRRLQFFYFERRWPTSPGLPLPILAFHIEERRQDLQVMLDRENVVLDFDFTDVVTETTPNWLGETQTTRTTLSP